MRTLYFAYGSNMDNENMSYRCPDAENMGACYLEGWGLRERFCADIEPSKNEKVHGVLWSVTRRCLKALDRYEGYPSSYTRKVISVRMRGCRASLKAIVYVMSNNKKKRKRDNQPFSLEYAKLCGEAAIENKVPVHPLYKIKMNRFSKKGE